MLARLVLALLLCLGGTARAADDVVNVFNWSDYIDPKVLDAFTKETGIKVVYDTYDSNEVLETRLLAGHTGYDVVVPSATFLQRQISAGVLLPLDPAKLANLKNLSPEIEGRLASYDPGNRYAVDYMWFTTGIAYNAAKAKERLGEAAIASWDVVFKPELLRRFADCGIYVLDSPEDMFTVALRYLKLDPNSKNLNDLRRAADLLATMRKSVRKFSSSDYINALANGDICLAVGWAGDSFQARTRAREAGNGVDVAYVVPNEGTLMSFDTLAIPKDAPHPANAYRFIDFLLRPDNAARNTQITNFANPVSASKPLIDRDITSNPSIYPDEAVMKTLFTVTPYDAAVQKFVTREWTRIKTGR